MTDSLRFSPSSHIFEGLFSIFKYNEILHHVSAKDLGNFFKNNVGLSICLVL